MTYFVIGAAILGLALFGILLRSAPEAGFFRLLASGIVLLVFAGTAMLRLLPIEPGGSGGRVMIALAFLWLAWVSAVAFVAQALRRSYPQSAAELTNVSALATLAPVAGLAIARGLM
ncbi:hypothetical protein [Pseudooceanicola sp.]|uniref:hypothetical protein n=1 Tax=Pseudooceanicola sp. TaxID=1914328 RepID=UPI0026309985|nr:hypothetical protein [Pseudooceanicola sp.]MDF1855075.1 hypothetical protein [Pseudooceanicola sp.]